MKLQSYVDGTCKSYLIHYKIHKIVIKSSYILFLVKDNNLTRKDGDSLTVHFFAAKSPPRDTNIGAVNKPDLEIKVNKTLPYI